MAEQVNASRQAQELVDGWLQPALAIEDPLDRAKHLAELMNALHEQVRRLAWERDDCIVALVQTKRAPSNRKLAVELGLARQRVDRLATYAKKGGRRPEGQGAPRGDGAT